MATRYPDSPTPDSIRQGDEFERFFVRWARENGRALRLCTTLEEQVRLGDAVTEDRRGIEIKRDNRCTDTGRLMIEIAERTALDRPWRQSGIFAQSVAELYVVGNFERFFIFEREDLRQYFFEVGPPIATHGDTYRNFWLPIDGLGKGGRPRALYAYRAPLRLAECPAPCGGSAAG